MNFLAHNYIEWSNSDVEIPPFNKEILCVYLDQGQHKIGKLTKRLPSTLSIGNPHRETLFKYEGFPYKVLAWMAPVDNPPPMPSLDDLYRWYPEPKYQDD